MSSIQQLEAFVRTARHGSFAAAARELGAAPSTLAKAVGRFEAQIGVRLFHRTTRKVQLTPDGERLFERCERVLGELEALEADAGGARAEAIGMLRVDLPVFYGKFTVLPRLSAWAQLQPKLTLDVRLHDAPVDIVRDGVDLAVRIGAMRDSTLVARRLDWQGLCLCAAPAYLERRGTPRRIEELSGHDAIVFRMPGSGRARPWQFRTRGAPIELRPTPKILVNETEGLLEATRLGLGLCQMPDYVVADALDRGELVELLPTCQPARLPISLVYPSGRLLPARVRMAIDVLLRQQD